MPTRKQLADHIAAIADRCQTNLGYSSQTLAKRMLGLNFAEVEEFCLSIIRRAVLDKKTDNAKTITQQKLEQWRNRLKPITKEIDKGRS